MAFKEKKQPETRDDSSKSEIMHRLKTHPFLFVGTVVVLVIVVVAFVFVPAIVPNAQRGGDLVFGYYNKAPIRYVLNNYFHQVLTSLTQSQQLSQDDPYYLFRMNQIWRRAFEETAIHLGVLDEMKRAGFVIPDDVVDREMASLPHFQENGRFSAAKYRAMDNNSRMNLWRQMRESIATERYITDMVSLRTPSGEAAFVSAMGSPRRTFDVAVFPFSSYPDSEVAAYAAANPELFKVTHLSRITVNSGEREARQVLLSVRNGTATFEEAAMTNSQDQYADKGGDMGVRMAFELTADIANEEAQAGVVNLPRGALSDLVKIPSGWAFFRAEDAARVADTADAANLEKIRYYVMENERGRAEDWLIAEAGRFIARAGAEGFDGAVSAGNVARYGIGPIPVNYGNSVLFTSVSSSGVQELAGAGANQFFWNAAFSTPLNTLSGPLVVGDSVIVLLPLEEEKADESEQQMIEAYFPNWINEGMETAYRSYFLNNPRLDDRFDAVFWSLWNF
jgi:hypothetical protein